MRVSVRHTTRLEYDRDVVERVMDVRLGPLSDEHQRWERYELRVTPTASVRRYEDDGANAAHLITIARAHSFVELVSGGEVETLLADPFVRPVGPPRPLRPAERHDLLAPSPLAPHHPEIAALAAPCRPGAPEETLEAVQALTALVHREFEYRPGVTDAATTLPEVLKARAGVCQDLAHVLIALCRAIGVPARYVSGYIVGEGPAPSGGGAAGGPSRGGEASHAWAEVYLPTHGWRGLDPTNNMVAADRHVKMAIGRDYGDVPPTRGAFRGVAEERLKVDVRVRRSAGADPAGRAGEGLATG